jgi:regulator of sigma D
MKRKSKIKQKKKEQQSTIVSKNTREFYQESACYVVDGHYHLYTKVSLGYFD